MDWRQFGKFMSAPDNVPIVGLIPLLAFYIYLAWKQAQANDRAHRATGRRCGTGEDSSPQERGRSSRAGKKKSMCGRFCCALSFSPPSSSPSS